MSGEETKGVDCRDRSRVIGLALVVGLVSAVGIFPSGMSARTIAEFKDAESFRDWSVVNDTVMGGVSQSSFTQTEEGSLLFSGDLSLANNGGFVSIRNRPSALSLQEADGIDLRVRGDGRTYYLDLRANNQRMAGSFRAPFETLDGEWREVFVPFGAFVAQSFGRALPAVQLDPAAVGSIGFTLSDKKEGPFQLEVEYVRSVEGDGRGEPEAPVVLTASERQRQLIELAIERGVPLFNEGNPAACAAVYEVACTALLAMPDLPDAVAASLRSALAEIKVAGSPARKAWILRYALDEAFAALSKVAG